jgi:prepilin-type N-terminal cleavage/methylation domain-containing protein
MSQAIVKKDLNGFTLIELMVVLAIMSIAFAIIGPNIMKTYDKVKGKSEVVELLDILNNISYKAFINGRPVRINLVNQSIHYQYIDNSKVIEKNFNYLTFPVQSFNISRAGFLEQETIIVKYGDSDHNVSLLQVNGL